MLLFGLPAVSRRAALVVFALLLLCPLSSAQAQNKDLVRADEAVTMRAALVIGNTNYEYKPLKNPGNDARAMAEALTKLGFKVTLKQDLTLPQMRETINAWADSLDGHTLALVYYSGHGVTNEGQNYLVPVNNAAITHKRDVPDLAYPFQRILQATKDAGCPLRIFILDACRNDPLPRSLRGDDNAGGLVKVAAPTGAFIAYAAASGETASDNSDGKNGLYTASLLKYIATPGLPIENLFKRVLGEVRRASSDEQHPDVSSQLEGDFAFAGAVHGGNDNDTSNKPISPARESSVKDYIGRGDELYADKNYEAACAAYTLAIAADKKSAEAYYNRGCANWLLERNNEAVADFTTAINIQPGYIAAYRKRASFYFLTSLGTPSFAKGLAKGIADYTYLIENQTNISNREKMLLHLERGQCYFRLKQDDKALADYAQVIRLETDTHNGYFQRAELYYSRNQYDKALTDYRYYIQKVPDAPGWMRSRITELEAKSKTRSKKTAPRKSAK